MKTIEEIQSELRGLIYELDQLKEEHSAPTEIDWEHLSIDAAAKAIKPHPLEKFDEYSKKCYLTLLLTVARFDEKKLADSMLLVHRIAFGMNYLEKNGDLRDEFVAAQILSYKQLDGLSELFRKTDEKLMLIWNVCLSR